MSTRLSCTGRVAFSGLVGVGSSTEIFESDFSGKLLMEGLFQLAIGPDLGLVVEGLYLGADSDPAGAVGFRWFRSRMAIEAGAVYVFTSGVARGWALLPWLGLAVRL